MSLAENNNIVRRTIAIMVPVILQNLITYFLNMIDSVMLSSYGQSEFAASSLANQAWFIYVIFAFGLSTGTCVLTSQYFASKDKKSITSVMILGLTVSSIVSVLFFVFLFFFPKTFMHLYTNDEKLIIFGADYLRLVAPGYLLSGFSTLYASYLKSVEKASLPLIFNCVSIGVNTIFNYLFIFGIGAFPELGIKGAAIATLISKVVEFVIMLVYLLKFEEYIIFEIDKKKIKSLFKDFALFSLPVLANESLWGIGASFQTAVFGRMGENVISAVSVNSIMERAGFVVCMGLFQAAAVILGIELGRGSFENAKRYSRGYLFFSLIFGIIFGILMYLAVPAVIWIFKMPYATQSVYRRLALILSILLFVKSINCMGICAILRSGGDSRAALLIDLSTMLFVTNPIGAFAAVRFGLSPETIYFIFIIEEFVKMPIMFLRIKKGKWLRNITR